MERPQIRSHLSSPPPGGAPTRVRHPCDPTGPADTWPGFVIDITPLRRHRHFRRLWAGQVVSGLGSQLTLVAVSFQVYGLTHSTLMVGLISLAQLVPLLAGALWGGTLAGRGGPKEGLGPHPGGDGDGGRRVGSQRVEFSTRQFGRCLRAAQPARGISGGRLAEHDGPPYRCWLTKKT